MGKLDTHRSWSFRVTGDRLPLTGDGPFSASSPSSFVVCIILRTATFQADVQALIFILFRPGIHLAGRSEHRNRPEVVLQQIRAWIDQTPCKFGTLSMGQPLHCCAASDLFGSAPNRVHSAYGPAPIIGFTLYSLCMCSSALVCVRCRDAYSLVASNCSIPSALQL